MGKNWKQNSFRKLASKTGFENSFRNLFSKPFNRLLASANNGLLTAGLVIQAAKGS